MEGRHWLIVYDIANEKRLNKVAKILSSYGWRVQKSVFESSADENTIAACKARILKVIDEEEDFVIFFFVCEKDWQKKESYGKKSVNPDGNDKFVIL